MERPPLPSTRTLDTLTWLVGATRGGTGSCCGAPRSRTAVGVVRRSEGVRFRARRGGHVGREGERTANSLDEALKERLGVARAGSGLRVELHREEGLLGVDDALVRAVVRVHKERGPVSRERLLLNGKAVVLRDPPREVHAGMPMLCQAPTRGVRPGIVTATRTCDVMKHLPDCWSTHGRFWPRLPNSILRVSAPAARARSWWPRQILLRPHRAQSFVVQDMPHTKKREIRTYPKMGLSPVSAFAMF